MYKLIIDHIIAEKILCVYWDEDNNIFPIVKKIDDVDFDVIGYGHMAYNGNIRSINFEYSPLLTNSKLIDEDFSFGEQVTLSFETEEDALYFQLKYGE